MSIFRTTDDDLPSNDSAAALPADSLQSLATQQADAKRKRSLLGIAGDLVQNYADRPSAYELYTKTKSKGPNIKGVFDAAAGEVADPMADQEKAMAYMKAKRENAAGDKAERDAAAYDSADSDESTAYREQLSGMFPKLAPSFAGKSRAQIGAMMPLFEQKIRGDTERDNKLAEIGASKSADLARMKTGKEMDLEKEKALKDMKGTDAEVAVDKDFAKDYANWQAGGGKTTVVKNLGQIQSAINDLRDGTAQTGGLSAKLPYLSSDSAQTLINPKMAIARDKIRGAVQSTLKETLGAQFTEQEGEKIMNRAFDPRLSTDENIRRATAVLNELQQKAAAKEAAGKYYEANRTLRGFKPASMADSPTMVAKPGAEPGPAQGASASGKPKSVIQNGHTYILNEQTGEYE